MNKKTKVRVAVFAIVVVVLFVSTYVFELVPGKLADHISDSVFQCPSTTTYLGKTYDVVACEVHVCYKNIDFNNVPLYNQPNFKVTWSDGKIQQNLVINVNEFVCSDWVTTIDKSRYQIFSDKNGNAKIADWVVYYHGTEKCAPFWECGDWSECSNKIQTRSCTDGCGHSKSENQECNPIVVCPTDTKTCADGSFVSRNPNNNCQFFDCQNVVCEADCNDWGVCANEQQSRVCDKVDCTKYNEVRACNEPILCDQDDAPKCVGTLTCLNGDWNCKEDDVFDIMKFLNDSWIWILIIAIVIIGVVIYKIV